MKKVVLSLFAAFLVNVAHSQIIADFESLVLPSSNYWKGLASVPTVSGFSVNPSFYFPNTYDTAYGGYWSGWGYSALSDSTSVSYATNELAAFPAKGANNSSIYAVAYESYDPSFNCIKLTTPQFVYSARIANTTIAYRSMQNGDGFAKKFGGASGTDPDYFMVTFTGWLQNTTTGSIDFYLADFRDSVNTNDYILKDWGTVNLQPLGAVDSISFHLSSSDTNSLGIKTPAYFCLDNLSVLPSSNSDISRNDFVSIYPNPFQQQLNVSNSSTEEVKYQLIDIMGRVLLEGELHANDKINIQTHQMGQGTYFLRTNKNESVHTNTLVKFEL